MMVAWPALLLYLGVAVNNVLAKAPENDVKLRVSMNMETLNGRPSTSHTFSNFELLNVVSRNFVEFVGKIRKRERERARGQLKL